MLTSQFRAEPRLGARAGQFYFGGSSLVILDWHISLILTASQHTMTESSQRNGIIHRNIVLRSAQIIVNLTESPDKGRMCVTRPLILL